MDRFDSAAAASSARVQAGCLLSIVAVYLALISTGLGPDLTDAHAFRQTQTAISARYLGGVADLFRYETPVLGWPWQIPFEFPLYQGLARAASAGLGIGLENAGRGIGIAFFLLTLWPLRSLLSDMGVRPSPFALAFVVLSPLYVFWSRAFLIETTALFLAVAFLASAVRAITRPTIGAADLARIVVLGSLAGLTKATTFLPVLMLALSGLAWQMLRRRRDGLRPVQHAGLALALLAPLVPAIAWVRYTDVLKEHNALGAYLTSAALREWNFGTMAQRLDPNTWITLANRTLDVFAPFFPWRPDIRAAVAALFAMVFLVACWRCDPHRRRLVGICLAMFVVPIGIFYNLHVEHNYYQCANGIFACVALGIAVDGARLAARSRSETIGWNLSAALLLGLMVASAALDMRESTSKRGRLRDIGDLVQRETTADSVIVIAGQNYSPVIPYRAQRRALMIHELASADAVRQALAATAGHHRIGAFVSCGDAPRHRDVAAAILAIGDRPPDATANGCAFYKIRQG